MGLGDVIFPGMLVLSAMQWLDPSVAFHVAMSTLVGGLVGYLALMTYVARGRRKPGYLFSTAAPSSATFWVACSSWVAKF